MGRGGLLRIWQAVLETFLRYHRGQGLSARRLAPEELLAPQTFEAFNT